MTLKEFFLKFLGRDDKNPWSCENLFRLPCAVTNEIINLKASINSLDDSLESLERAYINEIIDAETYLDNASVIEAERAGRIESSKAFINYTFNLPIYKN